MDIYDFIAESCLWAEVSLQPLTTCISRIYREDTLNLPPYKGHFSIMELVPRGYTAKGRRPIIINMEGGE